MTRRAICLAVALCIPGANAAEPEDADNLRPGLLAAYRSLADPSATIARIDARPAFHLGTSSPHPRLPPGPFQVEWRGRIQIRDPGPLVFDAFVCGDVTVDIDGVTVLRGRGDGPTDRVTSAAGLRRPPGSYPLRIQYRSLPERPARLQVGWEGPTFAREPLPAWVLGHTPDAVSPAHTRAAEAERGRAVVGQLGCARCHAGAFPAVDDPPPGPSLESAGQRLRHAWLLAWLDDPTKVRPGARMPGLFPPGRVGEVERWIAAEHLLAVTKSETVPTKVGDHRMGRRQFVGQGCAACHFLPDTPVKEQPDLGRTPLVGLGDRLPGGELTVFLTDPHHRYPDGRMPRLPLAADVARDIAAFLHLWSPVSSPETAALPPSADERAQLARRLGVAPTEAGSALLREKRCAACHPGLGPTESANVLLRDRGRGCLGARAGPRFRLDEDTRRSLGAHLATASQERHPSPFAARQRLLAARGCVRCHQRDTDRPSPLEAVGATLGGAWLQSVPYQRAPRLHAPHQKYTRDHLVAAVRDGVRGLRTARYTYRMPAYGAEAETLVLALAEADGELPTGPTETVRPALDPTLGPDAGPRLAGFQGYACVSCHVWDGKQLSETDPGNVGTDLTRVAGRIRRDWFDRFLEGPARSHPGTPMPAIFMRGQPALLTAVLDGDARRQKDALWGYLTLGPGAPSPKPPPALPVGTPGPGESPLVAPIPVKLPDGKTRETVALMYPDHDLFLWDVSSATLHAGYTGARLLREAQGRGRSFRAVGIPIGSATAGDSGLYLLGGAVPESPRERIFHGHDLLPDGVRLRWSATFATGTVEVAESLQLRSENAARVLVRTLRLSALPASRTPEVRGRPLGDGATTSATPVVDGKATLTIRYPLPTPAVPPSVESVNLADAGRPDPPGERPGYRAIAYPRPKTAFGEDRVMPGAVAVDPGDGRVFVASLKTGELFVLRDPTGDGTAARFEPYARGLFHEALSMHAEPGALYVLHRRGLTRLTDGGARADRVFALPHGVADTYDYAYGLARDRYGAFVVSYAPYANGTLPGSGGAVRLLPGRPPEELAYGFRNPLGWCAGPDGEIFCTDNQGEWVATNKLCHVAPGRYHGFPNPAQRHHADKPRNRPTVWVPYAWAKSINGVTYDATGGKFGPFAGQFFLAELMFGGAIVRAQVEKVNGQYQGACFPFWGRGLLGPLTLAFDPRGRLWVGGITEPGWMAQPDRGALFRIDYTGEVPFEMQSLHARPRGFRVVFTSAVDRVTAANPSAYRIEHFRYEYTGAYGSPELDRGQLAVERVDVAADGRSAELFTAGLTKDRVYLIDASGVRSARGGVLVQPVGAYTLNEVP